MHVALLNFEFEGTLETPRKPGGGTSGREWGWRQPPWACSLSISSVNALPSWMSSLVTKLRESCDSNGADAYLLPLGMQKITLLPSVRDESIYHDTDPC